MRVIPTSIQNNSKYNDNNSRKLYAKERLNNALTEVQGKILSEYYDSTTPITFKIYNAICTRTSGNIYQTISDAIIVQKRLLLFTAKKINIYGKSLI